MTVSPTARLGFKNEGVQRLTRGMASPAAPVSGNASLGLLSWEWTLVEKAMQAWLGADNFDEAGRQRSRLEELRGHFEREAEAAMLAAKL